MTEPLFTPPAFRMEGPAARAHIAAHSFGLLTLADDDPAAPPLIAPVPMRVTGDPERGDERLIGHVAKANPIWRRIDGRRSARAVFMGPHAYLSPRWYGADAARAVPTWNYLAAEVVFRPRLVEAPDRSIEILAALAALYEPAEGGWAPAGSAEETVRNMLPGIVAFEGPVERLAGKAKLSQNKSPAQIAAAAAAMADQVDPLARQTAAAMRAALEARGEAG
ncbi:MAG: FMN-binding negative transcriptional regulator [Marivibrio sp.]|uniref:FMN-binding negative transcriptional regulator n=1 Tax=Marivibrio sp. TaxID=2039719 RepID=UPI0032EC002F